MHLLHQINVRVIIAHRVLHHLGKPRIAETSLMLLSILARAWAATPCSCRFNKVRQSRVACKSCLSKPDIACRWQAPTAHTGSCSKAASSNNRASGPVDHPRKNDAVLSQVCRTLMFQLLQQPSHIAHLHACSFSALAACKPRICWQQAHHLASTRWPLLESRLSLTRQRAANISEVQANRVHQRPHKAEECLIDIMITGSLTSPAPSPSSGPSDDNHTAVPRQPHLLDALSRVL